MKRTPRPSLLTLLALAMFAIATPGALQGQSDLSLGLHYFAVEDLDQKQIVRRGQTGEAGIAFSNLILAPNTRYRIWVLKAETLDVARVRITTGGPGSRLEIPDFRLVRPNQLDSDGDGLHDIGERIVGTDPLVRDTDDDGVEDGPEVTGGFNPGDGLVLGPGIVGSLDLPGRSRDLCTDGDLLVVAHEEGITGINAFAGLQPLAVFRYPTTLARGVGCWRGLVAVAEGENGVTILDARVPSDVQRIASLSVDQIGGGDALNVTAVAGHAYVATNLAGIAKINLRSGTVVDVIQLEPGLSTAVVDVDHGRDHVWAGRLDFVYSIPIGAGPLEFTKHGESDITVFTDIQTISVAGDWIHASTLDRYRVIDISDPDDAVFVPRNEGDEPEITGNPGCCVKDVAVDPGGTAVLLQGSSSLPPFGNVFLYDASDPGRRNVDLGVRLDTPGGARRVLLANGLAYVADHLDGLQVVAYRERDTEGIPPTIELDLDFDPDGVPAGQLVRVTADVSDDVSLRDVRFEIDGQLFTDATDPFEIRFVTPAFEQETFTLRARAFDTGGNTTRTATVVVTLLEDDVPPTVEAFAPQGLLLAPQRSQSAVFSEQIDSTTLTDASFFVESPGPDGIFNSGDEVAIEDGVIRYDDDLLAAELSFDPGLAAGLYRIVVTTDVTDASGNALVREQSRIFVIHDDVDVDDDDVLDGLEDFDGDGLVNALEGLLGLDPEVADFAAATDTDGDGLADLDELLLGLDPTLPDFDGDGIFDGDEVADASNPFDRGSIPTNFAMGILAVFQAHIDVGIAESATSVLNQAAPESVSGTVTPVEVISVENTTD